MDLSGSVSATAEAIFATNPKGRIVGWNECAQALLGYTSEQVLGKLCFETFRGRDSFGNRFCDLACPVRNMIGRREPLRRFKLNARLESGERVDVWVLIVVVPGAAPDDYVVLHLVQPDATTDGNPGDGARCEGDDHEAAAAVPHSAPEHASNATAHLTPRELEVLRLLAQGTRTDEISERLFISVATVRNHIHHMLRKLGVKSRIEAISQAQRDRLL